MVSGERIPLAEPPNLTLWTGTSTQASSGVIEIDAGTNADAELYLGLQGATMRLRLRPRNPRRICWTSDGSLA